MVLINFLKLTSLLMWAKGTGPLFLSHFYFKTGNEYFKLSIRVLVTDELPLNIQEGLEMALNDDYAFVWTPIVVYSVLKVLDNSV